MADVKISGLPAATTPLGGTEVLPIVQGTTTKQVSVSNITAGRSVSATNFIPTGSSTPTNGMYLPATNTLAWSTNSAESMRLSSTGIFSIGDSTAATGLTPLCATFSTNTATGQNIVVRKSVDTAAASILLLAKSRGTAASPTAVQTGDIAGSFRMSAFGGTNYRNVGEIVSGIETYVSDTSISSYLAFSTNNASTGVTERARIFASGGVSIGDTTDPGAGNLRLGTGNLVIGTSGKGIDFSATAGTGTSELLADYEEGTFTATLTTTGGSITLKSAVDLCSYTKIGRQVTVVGLIIVDSVNSPTGGVTLNLPFAVGSGAESSLGGGSFVIYQDAPTYATTLEEVTFEEAGTSVAINLSAASIGADDQFRFSFTYFT